MNVLSTALVWLLGAGCPALTINYATPVNGYYQVYGFWSSCNAFGHPSMDIPTQGEARVGGGKIFLEITKPTLPRPAPVIIVLDENDLSGYLAFPSDNLIHQFVIR